MVKTKEQLEELVKESVLTWEGFDTSDESLKQIFDWENEIVATLDFTDLAKCLQVFRMHRRSLLRREHRRRRPEGMARTQ